jgi:hypothetical protein
MHFWLAVAEHALCSDHLKSSCLQIHGVSLKAGVIKGGRRLEYRKNVGPRSIEVEVYSRYQNHVSHVNLFQLLHQAIKWQTEEVFFYYA